MEPPSDSIESAGLRIPLTVASRNPKVERLLLSGRYDGGGVAALRQVLRPGDRVLDLGAGFGLFAATARDCAQVTAVEPDPEQRQALRAVLAANRADRVVVPDLDRMDVAALVAEARPDVLILDLERPDLAGLEAADLSGVRAVLLRPHPRAWGENGMAIAFGTLAARGFRRSPRDPRGETVALLERGLPAVAGHPLPARTFRDWPVRDARVYVATCMKDEGPFILEWLAWHKAMGITDLTVFTNDCSDGTDLLLDRLADMGHLQHLPNPALATQATAFQPIALHYAHHFRQMREADLFISMDVDEFINVTVGDGTLAALFASVGAFDVLSMSEVNHGANGREGYERGWLTELFPGHQTTTPGKLKARRGVKSIVRLSDRVEKLRNHRPDMRSDLGPILWRDGSGRVTGHFHADRGENGHDARGSFGLVRLEHFPLRSLDSYLAKMYRGDVVVMGKSVSRTYWRLRNRQDEFSMACGPQLKRAKAWFAKHLARDKPLMALHDACCDAHAARIASLVQDPVFKERRDWALREAWNVKGAAEDLAAAE